MKSGNSGSDGRVSDDTRAPDAGPLTLAEIERAVAIANIPTLLMVVFQMTGDERWLADPYLPTRAAGLDDHDEGGLPPHIQQEIREAAIDAVRDLQDGVLPAITELSPELTTRMLSACFGEPVGIEHGSMLSFEIARRAGLPPAEAELPPITAPDDFRIVVIGAGVAGIAAAQQLEAMGLDYTIVDRQPEPGGNWWQNSYPGAGVDTPSHLYSFSFAKNDWSRHFAMRDEIQDYFARVIDDLGVGKRIRYDTSVRSVVLDEETSIWQVHVENPDGSQEILEANIVISAVGGLNNAKFPRVEGLDRFRGASFHSSAWQADVDLAGKRVAVIGTGASSMQIVPVIAEQVASLTVFQRSPQWVAPFGKFGVEIAPDLRKLLQSCALYHAWYWVRLFWQFGDKVIEALRKDPNWPHPERSMNARNDAHRLFFTRYLNEQLVDRPDLVAKTLPDYPPFGKRILLDNGWYQTLQRDNVTLITDAVAEVTETGVVTDAGEEHDFDVLVWATGFQAARFLSSLDVRGRDGVVLKDLWNDDDPRAYLGMTIPGFPNFFMLGGPNSFPGSGSFMHFMEVQMRYLRSLITTMLANGIVAVEPKDELNRRYNELVDRVHANTVWTHPGMETYYRNSRGRVIYVMPFLNVEYWEMTRALELDDYTLHMNGLRGATPPLANANLREDSIVDD
jgi:4-hydroxyacetophenone monooxygenase